MNRLNQLIAWNKHITYKSKKRGKDGRFSVFVYIYNPKTGKVDKYPKLIQNVTCVKMYELKTPKQKKGDVKP